jgi:hypothetical protein
MVKKKIETNIEAIEGNIWASILLAKEEYKVNPSNQLYSIIIDLELTLREIKKIN